MYRTYNYFFISSQRVPMHLHHPRFGCSSKSYTKTCSNIGSVSFCNALVSDTSRAPCYNIPLTYHASDLCQTPSSPHRSTLISLTNVIKSGPQIAHLEYDDECRIPLFVPLHIGQVKRRIQRPPTSRRHEQQFWMLSIKVKKGTRSATFLFCGDIGIELEAGDAGHWGSSGVGAGGHDDRG
jgi:hypothetical protein